MAPEREHDQDAERARLRDDEAWKRWGPYLSERAWGTVREDYSADGSAWSYLPHDHARSRAFRWSEDGLGGICDADQHLCLAFALWNGVDPILKERPFGLTGDEGNHGEDVKDYWWYLDSTPTHSWMRWRYAYPQRAFPYADLVAENGRHTRQDPEYELLDTGAFDEARYWEVEVQYAKAAVDDVCLRVRVRNAGPEAATLHLLPTLWFRNRWTWDDTVAKPRIELRDGSLVAHEDAIGVMTLSGDGEPEPLFCDNESNARRLWAADDGPAYPKDGIGDHLIHGTDSVNPAHEGTKASLHYRLEVDAGATREIHLRLAPEARELGDGFDATLATREREADAFYATIAPAATDDERTVMRQAFAGMLWGKQFYNYDVTRWLDGDPTEPAPPARRRQGRNHLWTHVHAHDVISMPDGWEYPWFAAWDLAFHCVTLSHVDPAFAKAQLRLMTREWYMNPNGQLPAYEWDFSDVNPPVHAMAALEVFHNDGATDYDWLERVFHKLLLSFTWWANVKDPRGDHLYGGGFLGMDNVGPFDRSQPLGDGQVLEQADGTGWMAHFCLDMLEIALVLAERDPAYEDLAIKFFEQFTMIAEAMNDRGLWDETDGFYYDQVRDRDGSTWPVRVRSMTGLVPLYAVAVARGTVTRALPEFSRRIEKFLRLRPEYATCVQLADSSDGASTLALVGPERLRRILARLAHPDEFLSDYGVRSVSAAYRDRPAAFSDEGTFEGSVDYEPAESTIDLFGGNSNWRGPIWFPVNFLVIRALSRCEHRVGDDFRVEFPVGSGTQLTVREVSDALAGRLIDIFLPGGGGERPVFAGRTVPEPCWNDALFFHEYFHGDRGTGLGASHQTGWTGLVADLIVARAGRR